VSAPGDSPSPREFVVFVLVIPIMGFEPVSPFKAVAQIRIPSGLQSKCVAFSRAVQEAQQVLREGCRVQDVGDVLLARQHQQARVR
jgi:hypothetical protein